MMIDIKIDEIKQIAYSVDVFNRGLNYYYADSIQNISYNKTSNYFQAEVKGSEIYKVKIHVKDGMYFDSNCTCKAFEKWEEPCKHIVATLLFLMIYEQNRNNEERTTLVKSDDEALDEIVEQFKDFDHSGIRTIEDKTHVQMEYTLEYDPYINSVFLTIRIGKEQLYIMKHIKDFLTCMTYHTDFTFGKNYTYSEAEDEFSPSDRQVLRLVEEIVEEDEYLKRLSFGTTYSKLIDGKKVFLTNKNLKKFLVMQDGQVIKFNKGYTSIENLRIQCEDIPIEFTFDQKGDDHFELKTEDMKDMFPITTDMQVIRIKENLYCISKEQQSSIAPILAHYLKGNKSLVFNKTSIGKYISYVYPKISQVADVKISEEVENNLYVKPCQGEIYIDQIDEGITCKIQYRYGEYIFDSFEHNDEVPDEITIVRDAKLENQIMDIIEISELKVVNGQYVLKEEVEIYEFIILILPKLKELATVYYSSSVDFLKVKDDSNVSVSTRLNEGNDYFDFSFSIDGIGQEEIPLVLDALKDNKKYYRMDDGAFLSLDSNVLNKISYMMSELNITNDMIANGQFQVPTYQAFYINDEVEEMAIEHYKRNLPFKELLLRIREPEDENYEIPKQVEAILRGYQVTGYNWLKTLSKFNFGGILADDMGLGKTIQMLTFMLAEKHINPDKKSLIIAPTSLVYNWYREIKKFTPDLKVVVVDGSKAARYEKIQTLEDYDVLITSYAAMRNDIEIYQEVSFDLCVIDEAQHIKNAGSKVAKAAKQIKAKRKFALTGTPIENSVTELWSIFDFIMPGYLGSKSKFSTKYESKSKQIEADSLKQLRQYIKPFILRRLKKDVLKELPDKIENQIMVELSDEQKMVYMAYLEKVRETLEKSYKENGFNRSQMQILASLTRLRQICCHPSMFLDDYEFGSAKIDLLNELLDELIEGEHRVLIFSQFTSMLDIIEEELNYKQIEYFRIDGSTKGHLRGDYVESFNNGAKTVFLISLKAGGTGLNLTGADTVIHVDPWWNPAVEEQATDRAHRIGQEKKVHVIKLITSGTIEEKINQLQQRKREMIDNVIKPGETLISKMTEEEIKNLFSD